MRLESYLSIGKYNSLPNLFRVSKKTKHCNCLVNCMNYIFSAKPQTLFNIDMVIIVYRI